MVRWVPACLACALSPALLILLLMSSWLSSSFPPSKVWVHLAYLGCSVTYKTNAQHTAFIPLSDRGRTHLMELVCCTKDSTFFSKNCSFSIGNNRALLQDLQNEHTEFCGKTNHFVAVITPPVSPTAFPSSQNAKRWGKTNILCTLCISQNNVIVLLMV